MNYKIKTLSAALLLAVALAGNVFAANDALLLTLEGKVEVSPTGQTTWTLGTTNQTLRVGDRLRTGLRSRATVRLSNLTTLRVNELTTLQIQPPSAVGKQAGLDLKNGSTYFFSRERGNETEFRTPLASGAIRGTEFNLAVADDGRSEVTLIDGAVNLANNLGAVDLISGEQGVVENGKAPTKTAVLNAINIIQWALYYPGVIDPDELALTAAEQDTLSSSLAAYRSGDLLAALANYPEGLTLTSDAGKIYHAALALAVGQVAAAEAELETLAAPAPQADALRTVIAAVKGTERRLPSRPVSIGATSIGATPPSRFGNRRSASESLAESYSLQSQSKLAEALAAAREAAAKSPNFGFAHARVAELEFSFGHTTAALEALDKALQLSPRNAQAVALKGFLLAAQNKIADTDSAIGNRQSAIGNFNAAIALDPALGNAWLGRGLCRIKRGDSAGGVADLQVAATLEPNRSVLRSYLAKGWSSRFSVQPDKLKLGLQRAEKELQLAQKLDPNDPTPWLYSALLAQQENKINDAVTDLEKSQDLNDNRKVFRSRLLLDQDRAVRSANLAGVYRDAGMTDLSVREAARAVSADYANFSAHQFLASSYDALRDPKQINLRYETPWLSELLLANLLAPVGAGNLSQYVSQQEYSKLFERDRLGVSSVTEYRSRGAWDEQGSVFGTSGNSSFAVDVEHHSDPGTRPNNDVRQFNLSVKLKQQLTAQDSVFFQAQYYDAESGDVQEYYNQASASPTLRVTEKQRPNLYIGWHHEWNPGSHTLLLLSRLDDTLEFSDPNAKINFYRYTTFTRIPLSFAAQNFGVTNRRDFAAYTAELQQIQTWREHTFVAGARYQHGDVDMNAEVDNPGNYDPTKTPPTLLSRQDISTRLQRASVYAYDQWQIFDSLLLVGGVTYDWLEYPRNVDIAPIDPSLTSRSQVSPKLGFIWTPQPETHLRGAWTRSLGGVFFDNSVRIEPVQVAGFNQAFRSLAPESVAGLVPGTSFETWSLALDHEFKRTRTYVAVEVDLLTSDAMRTVGIVTNAFFPVADSPSGTRQSLEFRERTLAVTLNQLVGRDWSFGARYAISDAELRGRFVDVPLNVAFISSANQNTEAVLQQLTLAANYNHPCGFFGRAESVWTQQSNRSGSASLADADFWQFNLYAGWRFYHRAAELQFGLLNIGNQDYQLNPVNLTYAQPRGREFMARLKFNF